MPVHIFIFGPPGSGKSTQGRLLSSELGIPHLSVGHLLRAEAQEDTPEGQAIAAKMKRGAMVDERIILELLRTHLSQPSLDRGFILDGFPRTGEQLPMLERLSEELNLSGYLPVNINTAQEVCYERLAQRGRKDDTPKIIRRRLDAYSNMTGPILRHFAKRDSLVVVDGDGTVEEVAQRLAKAIREIISET